MPDLEAKGVGWGEVNCVSGIIFSLRSDVGVDKAAISSDSLAFLKRALAGRYVSSLTAIG